MIILRDGSGVQRPRLSGGSTREREDDLTCPSDLLQLMTPVSMILVGAHE